jgi:hypothetical protein
MVDTTKNPLTHPYIVNYVLAAFKTTTSAESETLNADSGGTWDSIGDGVIIANDLDENSKFSISSLTTTWSKYSAIERTSSMTGLIVIGDPTGGRFIHEFRKNVTQELERSTKHLVFSLATYFSSQDTDEPIIGNQLYFHVHSISDVMNVAVPGVGTRVVIDFTSAYNTTAQSISLSKPYQVTLTHKDGNLNNSRPEIWAPNNGIKSRVTEDTSKTTARKERMDKGKPMLSLKDAFEALEVELNQQRFSHKRQVQEWLSEIREDYEFKIDSPEQIRGDLPIKFKIHLDPIYKSDYLIDNRNLPFEQTEEDRENVGVTAIPFVAGQTIPEMVSSIMRYSTKVGEDSLNPPLDKSFRINISHIVDADAITLHVKIVQMTLPHSTVSQTSGPGDHVEADGPLEYTFKSDSLDDTDIIYLKSTIGCDTGVIPLEYGEKSAVYGNREPIMGERIPPSAPGDEFFKGEYSGLRVPIFHGRNTGVEDQNALANISLSYYVTNTQSSQHEIEIIGNPYLFYDLCRKPSLAAEIEQKGNPHYYSIPEIHPMYLKLHVYLLPDDKESKAETLLYFENYYEISTVITVMDGGNMRQKLGLEKTDNII